MSGLTEKQKTKVTNVLQKKVRDVYNSNMKPLLGSMGISHDLSGEWFDRVFMSAIVEFANQLADGSGAEASIMNGIDTFFGAKEARVKVAGGDGSDEELIRMADRDFWALSADGRVVRLIEPDDSGMIIGSLKNNQLAVRIASRLGC